MKSGVPHEPLDRLLEHAKRNKMLLHVLRSLNVRGQLRTHEENMHAKTLERIAKVAEALSDLDYTIFKVFRPVVYVPSDIDVLVSSRELGLVERRLTKFGLRAVVKDSYCLTLDGGFIVDLYTYPNFANIIYLDAKRLMRHVTEKMVNGVAVRTLKTSAEAAVVLAHALYKEQLYTLNDKITIETWSDRERESLVDELKVKEALKLSQKLNHAIDEGLIETPHKLPIIRALALMGRKALQDPLTRVTLPRLVARLTDRKLATHIMSRMNRITY